MCVFPRARLSAIFISTLIVLAPLPALAASLIGVTAALRGEVIRTASADTNAAIGKMSSGQSVFLGDDIKVGPQGRLQVMLLDETIFTLGANATMRIDEFVYDPAHEASSRLSTSIEHGVFRFVSGRIAKIADRAMKVELPSGTIGVRGTSVAGQVDADGTASVILLGPAPDNALGLPAGAISVINRDGAVNITRPGFATELSPDRLPPASPRRATPSQIRNLERALSEEAVSALAEGLGVTGEALTATKSADSDDDAQDSDGSPDRFGANTELVKAILAETGTDGGVTNDAILLEQVANTVFGSESLRALSDEERTDFFKGVNLGEDVDALLAGDFAYLGPTNLADLAQFGPNGRVTFTGSGATLQDDDGNNAGIFGLVQVWDFADKEVSSTVSGNFAFGDGQGNLVSGTFNENATQTLGFADARGAAMVSLVTSFSARPDFSNPANPATLSDPDVYATIGGTVHDRNGNAQIVGQAALYRTAGSLERDAAEQIAPGLSAFVDIDAPSRDVLIANTDADSAYRLDVRVNSFLSDVDRKDGTTSTASLGEGGVTVSLSENNADGDRAYLNRAQGTVLGLKRTVSE